MKTTKRVLAIVLAALMLALMVPFAASAANTPNVTFTLNYDKPANEEARTFEWTVYQLATLDKDTGAYTTVAGLDDDVADAIKDAKTTSSAAVLAACDAAAAEHCGTATGGVFKSGDANKVYEVPAGIYYVKNTKAPTSATLKNNSIVALPYYSDNAWQDTLPASTATDGSTNVIKLATKFSNSPTSIEKKVKDVETNTWVKATSQQQDKDVQFRTFVTTAGSATERLASYRITDSMNNGLKLKCIDSVKFFAEANSTSGTTVPATAYTVDPATVSGTVTAFEIAFNNSYLTADTAPAFYSNKYIEVIYTCTVLDSAKVGTDKNVNTTTMYYKPTSATTETPVGPDTAQVYVYEAGVFKYDASKGESAPLENAEFAIFATRDDAVNERKPIAVAKTGSDGKAKFVKDGTTTDFKFAKGTYFVKETMAPANFNKNTEIKEITLGGTAGSTAVIEAKIGDTPSKLPQTGGEGTMMFTIVGGSLIVLAGILFAVVMKKKKSSK